MHGSSSPTLWKKCRMSYRCPFPSSTSGGAESVKILQDGIRIASESLKAMLLKTKGERKEKELCKYFKSMTQVCHLWEEMGEGRNIWNEESMNVMYL